MKKQNMVLCATDEGYITKLASYYANLEKFPYLLWYFADVFRLQEFMKSHEVGVLLLDEAYKNLMADTLKENAEDIICFYLTKDAGKENREKEGLYLFQYQSANVLWEKMIQKEERIQMVIKEQDCIARSELIGFFAPVGEGEKTGLALGFAQYLAKSHRVLYLNFDGCAGIFGGKDGQMRLSDLFYFFLQSSERMLVKLAAVKKSMNGLDFILPSLTYQDVSQVTGEQWKAFIDAILQSGQYEYLIVDCSPQMQEVLDILELCGKVIIPYYREGGCVKKKEYFEQMLFCSHREALLRRIQWIQWKGKILLPANEEELSYGELEPYIKEIQWEE